MSTSECNHTKSAVKRAIFYLAASIFTAVCGGIYEHFGHGVYSYFMIYAFAFPLVLGVLPNLIFAVRGTPRPHKAAYNLYNSGVATLTVGSFFEGVLEVYGTTNDLVYVYLLLGIAFIFSGIIVHLATRG